MAGRRRPRAEASSQEDPLADFFVPTAATKSRAPAGDPFADLFPPTATSQSPAKADPSDNSPPHRLAAEETAYKVPREPHPAPAQPEQHAPAVQAQTAPPEQQTSHEAPPTIRQEPSSEVKQDFTPFVVSTPPDPKPTGRRGRGRRGEEEGDSPEAAAGAYVPSIFGAREPRGGRRWQPAAADPDLVGGTAPQEAAKAVPAVDVTVAEPAAAIPPPAPAQATLSPAPAQAQEDSYTPGARREVEPEDFYTPGAEGEVESCEEELNESIDGDGETRAEPAGSQPAEAAGAAGPGQHHSPTVQSHPEPLHSQQDSPRLQDTSHRPEPLHSQQDSPGRQDTSHRSEPLHSQQDSPGLQDTSHRPEPLHSQQETSHRQEEGAPPPGEQPPAGAGRPSSSQGGGAGPASPGRPPSRGTGRAPSRGSGAGTSTARPPSRGSSPLYGASTRPASQEKGAGPPPGTNTARPPSRGSGASRPHETSTARPPSGGCGSAPLHGASTARPSSRGSGSDPLHGASRARPSSRGSGSDPLHGSQVQPEPPNCSSQTPVHNVEAESPSGQRQTSRSASGIGGGGTGGERSASRRKSAMSIGHRLLLVGLQGAGKTTILQMWKTGSAEGVVPTSTFNRNEVVEHGGVKFLIDDLGGSPALRPIWRQCAVGMDCLIVVIDSTSPAKLGEVQSEMRSLLTVIAAGAALLVLANKQDLPGAMDVSAVAAEMDLQTIQDRPWFVQPTSALEGLGLTEALDWIRSVLAPGLGPIERASNSPKRPGIPELQDIGEGSEAKDDFDAEGWTAFEDRLAGAVLEPSSTSSAHGPPREKSWRKPARSKSPLSEVLALDPAPEPEPEQQVLSDEAMTLRPKEPSQPRHSRKPRPRRPRLPAEAQVFSEEALWRRAQKRLEDSVRYAVSNVPSVSNYPSPFHGVAKPQLENLSEEAQRSFLTAARYEAEAWMEQQKRQAAWEAQVAKKRLDAENQLREYHERKWKAIEEEKAQEQKRLATLEEREKAKKAKWKRRNEELQREVAAWADAKERKRQEELEAMDKVAKKKAEKRAKCMKEYFEEQKQRLMQWQILRDERSAKEAEEQRLRQEEEEKTAKLEMERLAAKRRKYQLRLRRRCFPRPPRKREDPVDHFPCPDDAEAAEENEYGDDEDWD